MAAIGGPSPYRQHNPYSRSQQENKQLALPSTVPTRLVGLPCACYLILDLLFGLLHLKDSILPLAFYYNW